MMFWLFAVLLAGLSVALILWPLLRQGHGVLARADGAMAIFRDQLAEVDRDTERGLISDQEAQAARVEIKRRMLTASREHAQDNVSGGTPLLAVMALLVPLAGALVYTQTGSPGAPSMPFAERSQETQQARDLHDLVARLRARLEGDPDGGEAQGWALLATTYMNLNRFADAVYAFSRVTDRPEATSATFSQYAEALIAAQGGTVTPRAQQAIDRALALDATNPAATFYSALALEQAGQSVPARQVLLDRISSETRPQPWMETFLGEANRIGRAFNLPDAALPEFAQRGPSVADMQAAADMEPEDRADFIRSMVERLATRLEDAPDDLEGWLQLARAYVVLGQRSDAVAALQNAQPLTVDLPMDDPRRQIVEQGLAELAD